MRITKKWLKGVKARLAERLEKVCTIVDRDWLVAEVKQLCRVSILEETSRAELIHYAIKWILEEEIPSRYVD